MAVTRTLRARLQASGANKFRQAMLGSAAAMGKAGDSAEGMSASLLASRKAMLLAGGAVAAYVGAKGLSAAVSESVKLERETAELAKLLDRVAAIPVAESMRELSSELPIARSELMGVAEAAARLGVRGTENISNFSRVMAEVGVATDLGAEQAATSMARIAKITQTPISEVRNLASAMNEASNTMAVSFSEVLDASLRAAPGLASLGASAPEIAALSASVGELSASSERAGTRLNRLASTLQDPDKVEAYASAIGVTSEQFQRLVEAEPAETIIQLAEALRDGGEGAEILKSEMQETSLKVLRALAQNADEARDAVSRLNVAFGEGASIGEEASRFFDTAASRTQILTNRMADLRATIGNRLLPAFVSTLEKGNALLGMLQDLAGAAGTERAITGVEGLEVAFRQLVNSTALTSDDVSGLQDRIIRASQKFDDAGNRVTFLARALDMVRNTSADSAEDLQRIDRSLGQLAFSLKGTEQAATSASTGLEKTRQKVEETAATLSDVEKIQLGLRQDLEALTFRWQVLGEDMEFASEMADLFKRTAVDLVRAGLSPTSQAVQDAIGNFETWNERAEDTLDNLLDLEKATESLGDAYQTLIQDSMERAREAMEEQRRETKELVNEIARGVRGAIDFGRALGFLGDNAAATLNSVANLGTNVVDVVQAFAKGGGGLGAALGPIGAAVGAAGSIASSLFGGGGPTPAERLNRDLQVTLRMLQLDIEKLRSVVQNIGSDMVGPLKGFTEFAGDFSKLFKNIGEGVPTDIEEELVPRAVEKMTRAMQDAGLSILDLKEAAEELGVPIDELIKVIVTGEGDLAVAAEQLDFFTKAVGSLPDSIDEATRAVIELSESMSRARRDIERFGAESAGSQFDILLRGLIDALPMGAGTAPGLGGGTGGPLIPGGDTIRAGPQGALAELINALQRFNLQTAAARSSAIDLINDFINRLRASGQLIEGVDENALERQLIDMIGIIRQIGSESARDSVSGAGGGTSVGEALKEQNEVQRDFIRTRAMTEVQADELIAVLRSDLLRSEQRNDILIRLLVTTADLPSNIAEGQDIFLGDELEHLTAGVG